MPLIAPLMELKLSAEINTALSSAFGAGADSSTGAASHKQLADAIAKAVAKVIVDEITTNAMVMPGIPTAGSPVAQATVGPGKIL